MKKLLLMFVNKEKRKFYKLLGKSFFWFSVGAILGLCFFLSFLFLLFERMYDNVVYPGVLVDGINFGGKNERTVEDFFKKRNARIGGTSFTFMSGEDTATASAKELQFGYDEVLLSKQAFSIGRSADVISNASLILQAYINNVNLSPSFHFSENKLSKLIKPIQDKNNIEPTDALFTFQNGKVTAFRPSSDGQTVDMETLKKGISSKALFIVSTKPKSITITIPIKTLKPKITTDKANNLGIKELIGEGTSLFQHSIPNRIFNVTLGSTRVNGTLVAPNEVFSFNKAIGDISAFTGYQQAYVIQNGRTVLGDGGGVCQISTTLFRAALNAGLPIIERHAHAYRVGYYEEDSAPGVDATVYAPSVDFRFKNDTNNYILIQTSIDPSEERLTFTLYGRKDGRTAIVNQPIIISQSSAPAPVYQDDPTLEKGVIKQVDFAAGGANVYFTREVKKNGKVIISEKFISNYRPWAAVFLRGTKE